MTSNEMLLARAHSSGAEHAVTLDSNASRAQVGALLALSEMTFETNLHDHAFSVHDSRRSHDLYEAWEAGSPKFWSQLQDSLLGWSAGHGDDCTFPVGYWLTRVRSRGISFDQTVGLTKFLAGRQRHSRHPGEPGVRRYPTGGISEKQAILLPAILHALARQHEFHSSFLIARRLAHTGGTRDKLSILEGFTPYGSSELDGWSGAPPKVRYFTADEDFCPLDEVLYFLRGNTGTVVERGLMISSILAKQLAMPLDCILIDVLYGQNAFLSSKSQASDFISTARAVGDAVGLQLIFRMRSTAEVTWRAIGNVAELVEVWRGLTQGWDVKSGPPVGTEPWLSSVFADLMLDRVGLRSSSSGSRTPAEGLNPETVQESMLTLWLDHGVERGVVTDIAANGESALLRGLFHAEVTAASDGRLFCRDPEALADLVNNQLNAYGPTANGPFGRTRRGGILLDSGFGAFVESGQPLVHVYSEVPIGSDIVDRFRTLLLLSSKERGNE